MSFVSLSVTQGVTQFFDTVSATCKYTLNKPMEFGEKAGLNKVARIGFRFFKSFGDKPKDFAKLLQVLGSWVVVVCDKKGAVDASETAQKVSDFAKYAKCFLSFCGIWSQLGGSLRPQVVENGHPPQLQNQPARNGFTSAAVKTVINTGSMLCASACDSVSLFHFLGLVSAKNKYFEGLKIVNCIATVLAMTMLLKKDAIALHGECEQGHFISRNNWENAISLIGNGVVFSFGFFPLLEKAGYWKGFLKNNNLYFTTMSVITNFISKHVPNIDFS